MRLVARFMKPYWALCAVTTVLLLVDVVGALVIPTFAAELLNESATSASFKKMTITAVGMGVAALISGMCAVAGGWCCSQLTSRVGKDMRMALYRKSMDLSTQRILCGLLLKVPVCRPQCSFQLRVVGRAQQMAHSLPHGVAQLCTLGKCLPCSGKIFLPYCLKGAVQVG